MSTTKLRLVLVILALISGTSTGTWALTKHFAAASTGAASAAGSQLSAKTGGQLRPTADLDPGWRVDRVVDGDTVVVTRAGHKLKLRLIGIDTPETVDPRRPVGCYGPQASAYAKHLLTGRTVRLEYDKVAGSQDRYHRTLAYLWIDRRTSYNYLAIAGGYAREYDFRHQRYAHHAAFLAAQRSAQAAPRGLWKSCPATAPAN